MKDYADIAQLVEQGFCKPKVRGSSPCVGTINRSAIQDAVSNGRSSVLLRILQLLGPETSRQVALSFSGFIPDYQKRIKNHDNVFKQNLFGRDFHLPIGSAAGIDKDAVAGLNLFRLGFGFLEFGTVTPLWQSGNSKPRLFRLPTDRAVINRMGFNNKGADSMARNLQKIQKIKTQTQNQIIGVNIGKNKDGTMEDYQICFEKLGGLADYVVINISSPNTVGLREMQNPETIKKLLDRLKEIKVMRNFSCAILLKFAPDIDKASIKPLAKAALDADGLILTNTTVGREGLTDANRHEDGGLSGAPLFDISTRILKEFASHIQGEIPLIGVGGISNAAQAYEKIRAGASLLQLYTSLIYNNLSFVADLQNQLAEKLQADGFSHISQAIGKDV